MAYTDEEWDNVVAFLQDEAEKDAPEGIGKQFENAEEFVRVLRIVEAIKPNIVRSNAQVAREFARLVSSKDNLDQGVIDLQAEIDNHPGNPNNQGGGPL